MKLPNLSEKAYELGAWNADLHPLGYAFENGALASLALVTDAVFSRYVRF